MADSNKIQIDFEVVTKSAISEMKKMNDTMSDMQQQTTKTSQFFSNLSANLAANLVQGGIAAAKAAFSGLISITKEAIAASAVQSEAVNDLNTALKLNGGYTAQASADLQAFAGKLQETSTFGDETTIKVMALASSLTGLSGEKLEGLTQAAAELAAVTGQDLETSMQQIIKSSATGGAAMRKYGVEVKEGSTQSQALDQITQQLTDKFGGTALAKTKTFSGALAQATNSYGDMYEEIGLLITQNTTFITLINAAGKIFTFISNEIKKLDPKPFQDLVKDGVVIFIDALITMVDYINPVFAVLRTGFNGLQILFNNATMQISVVKLAFVQMGLDIVSSINSILSVIPDVLVPDGWKDSMKNAETAMSGMSETLQKNIETDMNDIKTDLNDVKNAWVDGTISQEGLDKIKGILNETKTEVLKVEEEVKEVKQEAVATNLATVKEASKEEIEAAKKRKEELLTLKQEQDLLFEEQQILHNGITNTEDQARFEEFKLKLGEKQALEFMAKEQLLAKTKDTETKKHELEKLRIQESTAMANKALDEELARKAKEVEAEKTKQELIASYEKNKAKFVVDSATSSLKNLAMMNNSFGKKAFEAYKAASIAQTTIKTYEAAQGAYASLAGIPVIGPALGAVAAAAAVVAGYANIRAIQAQSHTPAYEQGGIVGGASFTGDKITARVNSGEMILNQRQQANLFKQANNGGNSNDLINAINVLGNRIASMEIVLKTDDNTIARSVNRSINSGFILASN